MDRVQSSRVEKRASSRKKGVESEKGHRVEKRACSIRVRSSRVPNGRYSVRFNEFESNQTMLGSSLTQSASLEREIQSSRLDSVRLDSHLDTR